MTPVQTPRCDAASSDRVALTPEARGRLHSSCPGAYRTPAGKVGLCDCHCHDPALDYGERERWLMDLPDDERAALPIVDPSRGVAPGAPEEAEKRARVAPETPTGPRSRPGECECGCGAAVGPRARFRPGHDAKLKSRLLEEAVGGSAEAWAEICERKWEPIVNAGKVPMTVRLRGRHLAHQRLRSD